jgi:hypothetical protein
MSTMKVNQVKHTVEATINLESFRKFLEGQGVEIEGKVDRISCEHDSTYMQYEGIIKVKVVATKEDRLKELNYDGVVDGKSNS